MNGIKKHITTSLLAILQHYHPVKYWKMRDGILDNKTIKMIKYYYLFRVKRMEAFNNSSLGISIGWGATFKTHPKLPHGIRGIFIHNNAKIGENCIIYQHVTIGERQQMENSRDEKAPIIGDNVLIGAGAKVLGGIRIGNNVKIGSNCVVTVDIEDNCTVVVSNPRIIFK